LVLADRSRLTEENELGSLVARTWRFADLGKKRALLLAGFGFGAMPIDVVERDLAKKRLVEISLRVSVTSASSVPLHALWRRDEAPGPAAQWLIDRLEHGAAETAPSAKAKRAMPLPRARRRS
jgi:DNA-binding transcriptional LysR family regulator